jgi:hypothetical protein
MPAKTPARYGDGKECVPFLDLMRYSKDPERLSAKKRQELEGHLDRCAYCLHQLEVAERREWKKWVGDPSVPEPEPLVARGEPRVTRRRRSVLGLVLRVAAAVLFFCLVGVTAATAVDASRKAEENRQLKQRLDELQKEIQDLGIARPVTVDDPKAFSIVPPGRNRLKFAGEFNPLYIQEVHYRFGTEPDGAFTTLYKADSAPTADTKPIRFAKESEMPLNGDAIVAVLEFVPYAELRERFPHFFPPERLQYSRTFRLAREGIEADPELVVVTDPRDGGKVEEEDEVEGRASIGWPVILVMPLSGDRRWYVQDAVPELVDAQFRVKVHFGNDKTEPGAQFRLVVVAARTREEALKFRPGTQRDSLPAGLPRSQFVTVVRK